ncbi:MAG TPA: TIGR00645 family protein [Alphaproteobacteria bacterium]|jgi:uncharacterized protein (TIGR00645 family)|nr:TIGR00645 family protein [Alphaproteobacteria bacterium]
MNEPQSAPEPNDAPEVVFHHASNPVERGFERLIFMSRWLLAPFYLGLALALIVLLYDFVMRAVHMVTQVQGAGHDTIIIAILGLIDLSLMGNLVLMVMFAGYESFISKLHIDDHNDRLDWMGEIGFGDLKLKLMTSIVAISAIRLLETFMDIENLTDRELAWTAGIHVAFVVSGLLLALMERLMHK